VLAAQASRRLELSTSLAIAFPRSPMHVAHQSWDLQLLSEGRFRLGLGTQVRQVNERYYGAVWSQPVERMREYVLALQAIFRCWQEGEPLRHDGPFYRLSFMNPPFNPGPNPYGVPPVLLGALGPRMTQMTAEVADGLLVHPFTSERFVRERILPAVEKGLAAAGRHPHEFEIVPTVMIATGRTDEEIAAAEAGVAGLVAFYGSTPTYRPLLELEGLGDLHRELFGLSRQGRWAEMAGLVDHDVMDRFAVRGGPADMAPRWPAATATWPTGSTPTCPTTPPSTCSRKWRRRSTGQAEEGPHERSEPAGRLGAGGRRAGRRTTGAAGRRLPLGPTPIASACLSDTADGFDRLRSRRSGADMPHMDQWPDPTEGEARALIVGTATFWGCWALSAPAFVGGSGIGLVPFVIGFVALWWLYWHGAFHIVARTKGTTVAAMYFQGLRQPPWKAMRDRALRGWWHLLLPSYFRRAAKVLGWNERSVLLLLGTLLAIDTVVFVWMMTSVPGQ
jgi:probable F420-dependent oxidoreductase